MELQESTKNKISKNYTVKSITIGDHSVGKSTMINMYINGRFDSNTNVTIGVGYFHKDILLPDYDDQKIGLRMWDTAGQERFRSIARSYFRDIHVAFIVFDLTNRKSWEGIDNWKDDLFKYNSHNNISKIVLIGTKSDLRNRVVSEKEMKSKAEEWGCKYYIISSRNHDSHRNITNMFKTAVEDFHKQMVENIATGKEVPKSILERDESRDKYIDLVGHYDIEKNCCV